MLPQPNGPTAICFHISKKLCVPYISLQIMPYPPKIFWKHFIVNKLFSTIFGEKHSRQGYGWVRVRGYPSSMG